MDAQTELSLLCLKKNLTADFRYGEARGSGWEGAAHNWRVTLKYKGRQLTTDFFGGSAVTNPTAADVINSLCLDASFGEMDFGEFCSELGYDCWADDARKTWEACVGMTSKVHRLLGDDFETFASAEH